MEHFVEAIKVGDAVSYDEQPWMQGVVVQRVSLEYVKVLWRDVKAPLTHRESSLKRISLHDSLTQGRGLPSGEDCSAGSAAIRS